MQVDTPEKIRNVAVTGHNDTGKTTLTSALLYAGGVVNRLGKVEDGNTTTDFDQEEIDRGISIGLATCFVPWRQHKVNLVDCPGYGIFFTETRAGMRATDATLLCVNAVSGVEVNTEKVWRTAETLNKPVLIHLTKMDRERADFSRTVESLRSTFGRETVPIQLPIGAEGEFRGVVDLIHQRAWVFDPDGPGKGTEEDIPEDLAGPVDEWRNELIEAVAETDDELMEQFFEEGTLDQEQLESGLEKAVRSRKLFPVTAGCGLHGIGPSAL